MNLGGTIHLNKTGCCLLLGAVLIFFVYMFTGRDVETEEVITQISLRKLLAVAIKAAEDGGDMILATKNTELKIKIKGKTKEGANDSVTTADFRSHCVMLSRLKHNFPKLTIISEESRTVCDKDRYFDVDDLEEIDHSLRDEWVNEKDVKIWIDPLDATQEFTEKLYHYVTTMVCIAVRGEPIIGVIHKPFFMGNTTWGWVGQGHSSNLEPEAIQRDDTLKFIVSRSHSGRVKEAIEKQFAAKKIEIISAGGAGYKALEVASGRVDVYMHITAIKKWDICAGNAILNAVGGRMTTKMNVPINYADSDNPVNEDGILATLKLKYHDTYINL